MNLRHKIQKTNVVLTSSECESVALDLKIECGSKAGSECDSTAPDLKIEYGSESCSECQGHPVSSFYIEKYKATVIHLF